MIEEFIKEANDHLDTQPKDKAYKIKAKANLALIDFVLGLGTLSYSEYFQLGVSDEEKLKIETLIKERLEAKAIKKTL